MMPRVVFGQRTNSDKEQSTTLTAAGAGTLAGEGRRCQMLSPAAARRLPSRLPGGPQRDSERAPGPVCCSGEPCAHFLVEAADPRSPLRAARTYFFSAGGLPTDCLVGATTRPARSAAFYWGLGRCMWCCAEGNGAGVFGQCPRRGKNCSGIEKRE